MLLQTCMSKCIVYLLPPLATLTSFKKKKQPVAVFTHTHTHRSSISPVSIGMKCKKLHDLMEACKCKQISLTPECSFTVWNRMSMFHLFAHHWIFVLSLWQGDRLLDWLLPVHEDKTQSQENKTLYRAKCSGISRFIHKGNNLKNSAIWIKPKDFTFKHPAHFHIYFRT